MMETDHIIPKSQGGTDDIDNAIPLCFECHAEVHLYNYDHPRGRTFRPIELKKYRQQWLEICKNHPSELVSERGRSHAGPLSSVLAELEFNEIVIENQKKISIPFEVQEFHNVVSSGILSIINQEVKQNILATYAQLKHVNELNRLTETRNSPFDGIQSLSLQSEYVAALEMIHATRDSILKFLGSNL